MAKYNVDCLRDDELRFELLVRNVSYSDEQKPVVAEYRKALRKLLREQVEANVEYLKGKVVIVDEVDLCVKKNAELKTLLEGTTEKSPLAHKIKLQSRYNHLAYRITCLLSLDLSGAQKQKLREVKAAIKTVSIPAVDALLKGVSKTDLDGELRKLSETNEAEEKELGGNGDDEVFIDNGEAGKPLDEANNQKQSDIDSPDEVPEHGGAYFPSLNQIQHRSHTSQLQTGGEHGGSLGHTNTQNTGGRESIFAKLKNPVEVYLQNLKICDGLEVNSLIQFIKTLLKLKNETELTDHEIFEILSTRASGPLLSRIRSNKLVGPNVNHLHRDLITYFIPSGMRDNLVREWVQKVQGREEPLMLYINRVIEHSEILLTGHTERALVDIMILGLNQSVRARLVFHKLPRTFTEMYQMCIYEQNIRFSDSQRGSFHHGGNRFARGHFNQIQSADNRPEGNPIKCYNCNREGHIARNCPTVHGEGRFLRGGNNNRGGRGNFRGRGGSRFSGNGTGRGGPSPSD